jgi:hypothetical protein
LRTLLIAALAMTLAGCSRQPPPSPLVSTGLCADANRFACLERRPGPPTKLGSARINSAAMHAKSTSARKTEGSSFAHVRHRARLADKTAKPTRPAAKAEAAAPRVPLPPALPQTRPEPARSAAADANASSANVGEPHPAAGTANADTRMIEAQAAAARVLAERVTAAGTTPAPDTKASRKDSSNRSQADGNTEGTASASADDTDRLVAVLMVRPDIKSVSDLAGKTIAIDDRYSASNSTVRTAIVAAGAPEVQLSEGQTTAINRLVDGEVPAAVLALVSPNVAEGYPVTAGFKTFRIPLSPRSLNE